MGCFSSPLDLYYTVPPSNVWLISGGVFLKGTLTGFRHFSSRLQTKRIKSSQGQKLKCFTVTGAFKMKLFLVLCVAVSIFSGTFCLRVIENYSGCRDLCVIFNFVVNGPNKVAFIEFPKINSVVIGKVKVKLYVLTSIYQKPCQFIQIKFHHMPAIF